MRLGVLGGCFDPVHIGHTVLANDIVETLSLDRLLFLVSYAPPHRTVETPFEHRLNMVSLALGASSRIEPSDFERELGLSPSYTLDVLRKLSARERNDETLLIVGSDQYARLSTWHEPDEVRKLATVVVLTRRGFRGDESGTPARDDGVVFANNRLIEVSSSEIRRRVGEGLPVHHLVPEAVLDYIRVNGLYGHGGSAR